MRSSKWIAIAPALALAACELVDPTSRLERDLDATFDVVSDANDAAEEDAPKDAAPSCAPPDGANPCANVTANGCYCSGSTQTGFNPAAAVTNCLYVCINGSTVAAREVYCASGCIVAPPDSQDYCAITDATCPP